jgi:transposase
MIMNCPKCIFGKYVKSGFNCGRQRYKCKLCGYHYSVAKRGYDKEVKEYALRMVADGSSFRQVARVLEVSQVTVMRWVRKYGEQLLQAQRHEHQEEKQIEEVEIDELCTFVGKKKT